MDFLIRDIDPKVIEWIKNNKSNGVSQNVFIKDLISTAIDDQDNLNNKKLIAQASLATMILPEQKDSQSRKGFVIACVLEAV